MLNFTLSLVSGLVVATAAVAHPGHGESGGGFSLFHYLTEPVHVAGAIVVVLGVLTAASAWRLSRRRASRR